MIGGGDGLCQDVDDATFLSYTTELALRLEIKHLSYKLNYFRFVLFLKIRNIS